MKRTISFSALLLFAISLVLWQSFIRSANAVLPEVGNLEPPSAITGELPTDEWLHFTTTHRDADGIGDIWQANLYFLTPELPERSGYFHYHLRDRRPFRPNRLWVGVRGGHGIYLSAQCTPGEPKIITTFDPSVSLDCSQTSVEQDTTTGTVTVHWTVKFFSYVKRLHHPHIPWWVGRTADAYVETRDSTPSRGVKRDTYKFQFKP